MVRHPHDTNNCPLYNRKVSWTECYEVQEVRDDEMDLKWIAEPIDIGKANEICEKCRWYIVRDNKA